MTLEVRSADIELRAAEDSPGRIFGTLIEMGRVAVDRREVFAVGSIRTPSGGVRLLAEHRGREVMTFEPIIDGATIRIDKALPDTALGREVAAEVRSRRKGALSIEFYATQEAQVQGVREVRSALMDAAAVVASGAYDQARVEVRADRRRLERRRAAVWL